MDDQTTIRKRRRPAPAALGSIPAPPYSASNNEHGNANSASPCTSPPADEADSQCKANANANYSYSSNGQRYMHGAFDYAILSAATIISLTTTVFVVYGFILRASFHHGRECDMTYSRFKFLPLEVSNYTAGARPYRLLKFVDARDPRNLHLSKDEEKVANAAAQSRNPHDDGIKVHQLSDNWCLLPQSDYTVANGMSQEAPYPNPGHPVLFVPGHWGEYKQARSLGAHGTTFTRRAHSYKYQNDVARGLMDGTLNGKVRSVGQEGSREDESGLEGIDHFIYDVYTADFDGEGAGLHGSRLVRQAHFLAQSILTIVKACNAESVTVVAHSVGGIVARAVPFLSPETRQYIRTIITLATPHNGFPYAFDASVQRFYNFIEKQNSKQNLEIGNNHSDGVAQLVVSISGGLRDELIPPSACSVDRSLGLSMLATDVMPASSAEGVMTDVSLGCDHKAISWCHNVLSAVRTIIFSAAGTSLSDIVETRATRLRKHSKLETDYDYSEALRIEEQSFRTTYGFSKTVALQMTMPYRAWELVALYVAAATVQTFHGIVSGSVDFMRTCKYIVFLPAPLSVVFMYLFPVSWSTHITTILLSTGSCLLYAVILHGVLPLLSGFYSYTLRRKQKPTKGGETEELWWKKHVYSVSLSATISASIMYLYHFVKGHPTVLNGCAARAVLFWSVVLHIFSQLVWSSVKSGEKSGIPNTSSHLVAALFLPTLPFLVAGNLTHALSLVAVGGQVDDEAFLSFQKDTS